MSKPGVTLTHSVLSMQSCMMPFQLSPVAMRKSTMSALGKFSKLAWRLRNSWWRRVPKRFMPMIAKMKKKRKSTLPTLTSAGSEKMSVWNSVRRPLALGMRRKMRATRNTRSRLTTGISAEVERSTEMPTMEKSTTMKSKVFQLERKYWATPKAKSLSPASTRKMLLKITLAMKRVVSKVLDWSTWVIAMKAIASRIIVMMKTSNSSEDTR
mmetsp:Transcript_58370/g.186063  ORF Transcript_58370/g.186063 Transcript_58370/m.186063 type:complete len:211 (-) Transcript_58370:3982-4614(-)